MRRASIGAMPPNASVERKISWLHNAVTELEIASHESTPEEFQPRDAMLTAISYPDLGIGISLLALGSPDRTGGVSSVTTFQAALNMADTAGEILNVIVPQGTYLLDSTPTASAGTVNWIFLPGVVLTGAGTLPFHQKFMNLAPLDPEVSSGLRHSIWHGTYAAPTADGNTPTDFVGRADNGIYPEDGHVLKVRMTALQRKSPGTGWVQANKTYVEDYSTSANTQTVANANIAYMVGPGAIWGVYSETHGLGANCNPVSCELDVTNYSGADYLYNDASPASAPCSKALWILGAGNYTNTFAIGMVAFTGAEFGGGIYIGAGSVTDYGIDIQATPQTLMRFKYGASGGTGVGMDFGVGAAYGFANGQGAMNIWNHRISFGPSGKGFILYNPTSHNLEFGYDGVLIRSIDMTSAYAPL